MPIKEFHLAKVLEGLGLNQEEVSFKELKDCLFD